MNKLVFKVLLVGVLGVPSLVLANSAVDEDFCTELKSANAEMEEVLLNIQNKKQADIAFLKAMERSQEVWIEHVNAELAMQFPSSNPVDYGSVLPMCQCISRLGLAQERITLLKQWLEPGLEGDVCTGSKLD